MRIFVTGATGFIGSALVPELINASHQVLGLTRSEAGAKSLIAAGAPRFIAAILPTSKACARGGHVRRRHPHGLHSRFFALQEVCEVDRRVIEALGSELAGSDRPLLITSGTGMANGAPGRPATEQDDPGTSNAIPRVASEQAAAVGRGEGRSRGRGAPAAGPQHRKARTRHFRNRTSSPEGSIRLCRRGRNRGGSTSSTRPVSTGWHWSIWKPARDIMPSPKKAWLCATLRKSSAED